LTVSEFIVATQAVLLTNPFVMFFEGFFFVFLVLAHCYFFIIRRRPIFLLLGNVLRRYWAMIPSGKACWAVNFVMAGPVVWFFVNFVPRCIVYLWNALITFCYHVFQTPLMHWGMPSWFDRNIVAVYLVTGVVYFLILFWKSASPVLLFWKFVGYQPKENRYLHGVFKDVVIWVLHLVIFYAFGRTLLGFLQSNLNAVAGIICPSSHVSWRSLIGGGFLSAFHVPLGEDFFIVMRYTLWSFTIIGCLLGYWYSILGYLFGKRIRNLDFTVMGWLTNAACYGPLIGVVVWQMTPALIGKDPVLAQGPLKNITLVVELMLNLFYTASIWNLGTMFGVMTDKGVRTSYLYSVIRHPSYTLEALMFIVMFMNGLSTGYQWLAAGMFILTYYVRSEREDNFMERSNPDYRKYQQVTPYKFIPGIY
jgi:protein-S-isoprenylcysteine O-methyltransferase Ste14